MTTGIVKGDNRLDKVTSTAGVVDAIQSGMTIGVGGWGARRKPMSIVRELCRSDVHDLTVVSFGGPDVGLLCAAGKVRRLVYGFVSLDVIPLDPHFRRARENGAIEATELDEGMLYWALYAAALRLPFLPTRAGLGSDVMRVNPQIRTIESPYDDHETVVAMAPLRLDVALVHANQADRRGNAQILGPDPHFDEIMCAAADRAFVSCERVVPVEQMIRDGCIHSIHLNRAVVDGVVEAPYGAHPTSCSPDYGVDSEHLGEYVRSATDEASQLSYFRDYVDVDDDKYLEAVGGPRQIDAISATVY